MNQTQATQAHQVILVARVQQEPPGIPEPPGIQGIRERLQQVYAKHSPVALAEMEEMPDLAAQQAIRERQEPEGLVEQQVVKVSQGVDGN